MNYPFLTLGEKKEPLFFIKYTLATFTTPVVRKNKYFNVLTLSPNTREIVNKKTTKKPSQIRVKKENK